MAERSTPSSKRYVALLRGINVGGSGKVEMAALRSLFESLGYLEVRTYIQSGNVIFTGSRPPAPAHLAEEIAATFAIGTTVIVRTHGAIERAVANNPFPDAEGSYLHIGFMAQRPTAAAIAALEQDRYLPDRCAIIGSEVYLCLPNGVAGSKLPTYLDRQLKVPLTMRNWNTVNRLVDLSA